MRALIVDVRGNPGGLLNASVEVADKFLATGTIVSTRGRSAREDFDYQAHSVGTWRVPLIVLIDGDSASASEIFAGAIHDHRRGTVVGQRSYGKGSVQGIFPLSRYKSGIRLTTAKFYSPSGQPISHHGVTPNVVVPRAASRTRRQSHWRGRGPERAVRTRHCRRDWMSPAGPRTTRCVVPTEISSHGRSATRPQVHTFLIGRHSCCAGE